MTKHFHILLYISCLIKFISYSLSYNYLKVVGRHLLVGKKVCLDGEVRMPLSTWDKGGGADFKYKLNK